MGRKRSQVQSLNETVNTVYSDLKNYNYSKQYKQYSHSKTLRIFTSLSDLIPDDGYLGFYVNKLKDLGEDRFMEIAQKARAGSDTPAKLFAWMLKNHEIVR